MKLLAKAGYDNQICFDYQMFQLEHGMNLKENLVFNKYINKGEETIMTISWLQAALLRYYLLVYPVCQDMGGTSIGNYTLGRPLVGGLVCGIVS